MPCPGGDPSCPGSPLCSHEDPATWHSDYSITGWTRPRTTPDR